ncbi:hypothetical protein B0H14DRAFT_2644467 [Mycena olivaceomarginata]|nr:hypothetical protein B0H14DRAFT_2644467 [Mycena olivaceomarginata]
MDICEAVRESVKIRLYCDTMLIDAVPIEEVEREIGPELRSLCAFPDLNGDGRHRILRYKLNQDPMESGGLGDNTVPEVNEVEDAVDVGVGVCVLTVWSTPEFGGFEGRAVLLLKITVVFEEEEVNVAMETDVEGPGAKEGDG